MHYNELIFFSSEAETIPVLPSRLSSLAGVSFLYDLVCVLLLLFTFVSLPISLFFCVIVAVVVVVFVLVKYQGNVPLIIQNGG